jgi:hypothetical protein
MNKCTNIENEKKKLCFTWHRQYCYNSWKWNWFTGNVRIDTASVVEGLESMTSNPVTSLARVWSPGDALVI